MLVGPTQNMEEQLLEAQKAGRLSVKQFLGIVFFSLLVGGKAWTGLPRMLGRHDDKIASLQDLETLLVWKSHYTVAKWLLENASRLDFQSWKV